MYRNQRIDSSYNFIQEYTTHVVPIATTADGNCLFHAISNSIYGNESMTYKIKIATVFIMLEYEQYFTQVLEQNGNPIDFQTLVKQNANLGEWGTDYSMLGLSILLNRPIYSLGRFANNCLNSDATSSGHAPLAIALTKNHFVGLLAQTFEATVSEPKMLATRFFKFSPGPIDLY